MKPSEERTSGNSRSKSETHFGVERRVLVERMRTKWQENLERSC